MYKADLSKITPDMRAAAHADKGGYLLPTGAVLYYLPGKGYWVGSYDGGRDAAPYC
jgi:hypothetical protein